MTAPSARLRASFTTLTPILLGLLLLSAPAAQAVTFAVNSTADAVDTVLGNGACATAGGVCTLRAAIQEANALAGADIITVPAGTYTLTIAGAGEDLAATGDLDITSNLTITGAGAGSTIIQAGTIGGVGGNGIDRVFHVTGAFTAALQNLTIANGLTGGQGGGIHNVIGTLTISNSTFSGNTASDGGGINNDGTLTISNSTFSGSSATHAFGSGGGISNLGTLTISNSTISGNSAPFGGGIYTNLGTLTISNSTISGNSATGGSGGIHLINGTVTLQNTIVANSITSGNCSGTITNGGNNLQFGGSVANSCGATITTANPLLGALTGSPAFFPLSAGSPAIDAGSNAICAAAPVSNTSQNGVTRPTDGDGNSTATCDIGSFEAPAAPLPPPAAIGPIPTLSEWALIGLAGLLGLWGMMRLRRAG